MVKFAIAPSASVQGDSEPLLRVEHLSACIETDLGWIWPIRDVGFEVYPGETMAVLGESGCGKTTILNAVIGALEALPGVTSGVVRIRGRDISPVEGPSSIRNGFLRKSVHSEYRRHRRLLRGVLGRRIGTLFQNHWQTLVPDRTISEQLHQSLSVHRPEWTVDTRRERIQFLMERLALSPLDILDAMPPRLSTGECQRASLALAVAPSPEILLCDEPTTGVDWEIRRLIHAFLAELVKSEDCGVLIVTHDAEEVFAVADRFMTIVDGYCVESGPVSALSTVGEKRAHPATSALLTWVPGHVLTFTREFESANHNGCPYVARCQILDERHEEFVLQCHAKMPSQSQLEDGHWVRCWDFGGCSQ